MLPSTQFDLGCPGCAAGSFGSVTSDCSPPLRMILSSLSPEYINHPSCNCFRLFMQLMPTALHFERLNAGNSIAARIAMIAITPSNSISVKPPARCPPFRVWTADRLVRCPPFRVRTPDGLVHAFNSAGVFSLSSFGGEGWGEEAFLNIPLSIAHY